MSHAQRVSCQTILVAGCAGVIGARASEMLPDGRQVVVRIDGLNDAFDVRSKPWRLLTRSGFRFLQLVIARRSAFDRSTFSSPTFDAVINLAVRADDPKSSAVVHPMLSQFGRTVEEGG